jgi:hypothetical protein
MVNRVYAQANGLREWCFLDLAAANAGCANAKPFPRTVHERVNRLKIQIPTALTDVVGMADAIPELRSTAAHFTNFCHRNTLPPHTFRADQSSTLAKICSMHSLPVLLKFRLHN